jgi:uncharacterized membrane protein YfhO
VQSLAEAHAAIANGLDFSKAAVVGMPVVLRPAAGPDAVRTVSYEPDALELEVTAAAAGMLVLSENNYPGWHAWIDGRETPIYSANIAFRGVAVPAGIHRIHMEFRPVILYWSLGFSAGAAILLVALAWRAMS